MCRIAYSSRSGSAKRVSDLRATPLYGVHVRRKPGRHGVASEKGRPLSRPSAAGRGGIAAWDDTSPEKFLAIWSVTRGLVRSPLIEPLGLRKLGPSVHRQRDSHLFIHKRILLPAVSSLVNLSVPLFCSSLAFLI